MMNYILTEPLTIQLALWPVKTQTIIAEIKEGISY